ncbi:MAG TPA: hypothetical protein G4N94_08390 [Caldilineae bacterium]|nr:hypothetical protein [Caldilineae bacterium]
MSLTIRLPNQTYNDYLPKTIALGTPLHFFLDFDLLVARDYDSSTGWYERVSEQPAPILQQIGRDQYAFCGKVLAVEVFRREFDIYYFVLLDCGVPVSLTTVDFDADPGSGDLGQHAPHPGRWLMGIGYLALAWGDTAEHPCTQTLSGTVTALDRLVLRPGPGFGQLRPEEKLQPLSFAPDQIFLTLNVSD